MPDNEAETILYRQHPVMWRANPVFFVLCIILCLVLIGALFLLLWWLHCKATTLTVTNERSTLRNGILSKHTTEVWHADVRNVAMSQGILQRRFGVGSIGIASAGGAGMEIEVGGLPKPQKAKDIIDQHRRAARS